MFSAHENNRIFALAAMIRANSPKQSLEQIQTQGYKPRPTVIIHALDLPKYLGSLATKVTVEQVVKMLRRC